MIRFIADIGSNHNRDFDRAIALIDACKRTGSQACKFQAFTADKLYRSYAPGEREKIQARELPQEWIPKLSKHARGIGLQFGCTPFDMESLAICAPHCDFIKISSFDVLRMDLIKAARDTNKQLIISTGMAYQQDIKEINTNLNWLRDEKGNYREFIHYLYCISKYPASINDIDFAMMSNQEDSYLERVNGYSDHTCDPLVMRIISNIFWDDDAIIEYHLDLDDMAGAESGCGHVWSESKITTCISDIRALEAVNFETYKPDLSQRADPIDGLRPLKDGISQISREGRIND